MTKKSKKQALSSKQLFEIAGGGMVIALMMALFRRRGATIIRKHGRHSIYAW